MKKYSTKEFAELVGRSVSTVYEWTYSGKLKPLKDFSGRNIFTKNHYKEVTGLDLEEETLSTTANNSTDVVDVDFALAGGNGLCTNHKV